MQEAMKKKCFTALCGCILLNAACVNEIATEVSKSDVPITFSVKIKETATKVSNDAFENGDKIGLYATFTGNKLSGERYIDNLLLTCNNGNTLVPEESVFYPEGDYTLDFVAYYPYTSQGVASGSTVIPIHVEPDQSQDNNFSASDFMTANKAEIGSSEDAVALEFNHRLTKLKITLIPGKEVTAEEMSEDNPRIIATGFHTKAHYDLETNSFSNFETVSDIVPAGDWQAEKGKLTGKELILIPQAVDGKQNLQMEWNGRVYTCPMPTLEELEGNMQYELEINTEESANHILNGVVSSIVPWPVAEELEQVENENGTSTIHLAVLSFKESNIYHVHIGGKKVAEICKEYLISEDLTSTAITSYPLLQDGTPDLSKGTVLQLLDVEEPINGGTISWNAETNSFTYKEGNKARVQQIYFDTNNTLCIEAPDEPAKLNIIAHTLHDFRDAANIRHYAIVKVGAQYWTRENLQAEHYTDGTELEKKDSFVNGSPGYFESEGYYFYNGEALEEGEISPDGWKIPSSDDWKKLETYIDGEASLIKAGEWTPLSANEEETAPVLNKTMLNIYPVGIWAGNKDPSPHLNKGQMAGFWSWDYDTDQIPEKTIFFIGEDDTMIQESTTSSSGDFYKGLSIRLIKK